jgi:hypothetical protein
MLRLKRKHLAPQPRRLVQPAGLHGLLRSQSQLLTLQNQRPDSATSATYRKRNGNVASCPGGGN